MATLNRKILPFHHSILSLPLVRRHDGTPHSQQPSLLHSHSQTLQVNSGAQSPEMQRAGSRSSNKTAPGNKCSNLGNSFGNYIVFSLAHDWCLKYDGTRHAKFWQLRDGLCIRSINLIYIYIYIYTKVGTLIVATIYLQLIQNRYMFRIRYKCDRASYIYK